MEERSPSLLKRENISKTLKEYYTLSPNIKALDIACGGGRHTKFLLQKGVFVDAIDISDVAISHLKRAIESDKLNLIPSDLDSYQFKKSIMD